MSKKVAIIGAGISGLTAGIYALKAGFDVELYESHTVVGGECTGWERNGYHIDGCIHWMIGTRRGSDLYNIWETTGALGSSVEVVNHEYLSAYKHNEEIYYLYSDLDRLQEELIRISPEDGKAIKRFIKSVKACQRMFVPANKPFDLLSFSEKIKLFAKFIKVGKHLGKAGKYTVKEYIADIGSPIIQKMIQTVVPKNYAAHALLTTLGFRSSGNGGWPMGGSYEMAQRMQKKFESLGGKLFLGQPIAEIIIEDGKAVGVRIKKTGEIRKADYIVPTIDAHALLNKLLDGKHKDSYFDKRFGAPESYPLMSSTIISIGVEEDISNRPHTLLIDLNAPLQINSSVYKQITIKHYGYDAKFCNNGKSTIEVVLPDYELDYWNTLKQTSAEQYKSEKARIANAVISEIQSVYPEITDKIKMTDVATPATFKRYCSAYKGSYMSFLSIPNIKQENHKGTIDGIQNMYLAGQWVFPDGGLPMAAVAGKFAIQRICKQERINVAM